MTANLIEHFASLEDPRIDRNKSHALIDIIVLTVCAVASGADGWEAIEQFGKEKLEWLRQYIALENGVPSHDCIAYVLRRVSPPKFRECFMSWTHSLTEEAGGEVIAIDGKTAKGSRDRKHHRSPSAHGQCLGLSQSAGARPRGHQMRNPTKLQRYRNCWRCWSSKGAS